MSGPALSAWPEATLPTDQALEIILRSEGLRPRWWSNGPGESYLAHQHSYHKVLYCARGSVSFTLESGERLELVAGDRLELPPGLLHSGLVGPEGVACIEAARG